MNQEKLGQFVVIFAVAIIAFGLSSCAAFFTGDSIPVDNLFNFSNITGDLGNNNDGININLSNIGQEKNASTKNTSNTINTKKVNQSKNTNEKVIKSPTKNTTSSSSGNNPTGGSSDESNNGKTGQTDTGSEETD
ncbi:hypothetical protein [Methanobrevibacter filiformis]|uniref:Lipoprotein n=1 Tax=Methanobrevibacter filiformis TaxID=55758 RepID=A0A166DS80_9EURY|nr:hypothetical protein [Methanobrevibacter filiformis]KZX15899.1 hypothetical protein MBFIL_05750 [Methanobrevibacter filiformis]